jgi:hypothetical protein
MVELLRDRYNNTDKNERERKDFRFPAIISRVLYNGESSWTAINNFKEMFNGYESFGSYLIDFEYILFDINCYLKEELLNTANVISSVFLLDQKKDRQRVIERLRKLANVLKSMNEDITI